MTAVAEVGETVSNLENSRDQTTYDFLTGLKEREDLKQQLNERKKELVAIKSQNFDLVKRIEFLEKEVLKPPPKKKTVCYCMS